MEKLFIPYETGIPVLAKQKGFDEPCFSYYDIKNEFKWSEHLILGGIHFMPYQFNSKPNINERFKKYFDNINCSAPTYEQIKDWLRIKHNIHIMQMVCGSPTRVLGYKWFVQVGMNQDCFQTKMIKDYHEGMIEAIKEALKLIS